MKAFLRILLLIISLSLLGVGGYVIYEKQNKSFTHASFQLHSNSKTLFFPDLKILDKNKSFDSKFHDLNLPEKLIAIINELTESDKTNQFKSLMIQFDSVNFLMSLLEIQPRQNNIEFINNKSGLLIDNKELFYLITNVKDYIIDKSLKVETVKGNFDFYIMDDVISTHKSSSKLNYSTSSDTLWQIKGKGVSPYELLSVCPKNNDEVELFGSTKFQKDIIKFLNVESSQFFGWTDNVLAVIKKDSYEIIISKQNNILSLEDQLLEMTLELAEDSLLPPSIFINNFEILKFNDTLNWSSILPQLKDRPRYFTSNNNFIYLANSMSAMQWLAKETQLGELYSKQSIEKKIPHKLNYLKIKKEGKFISTSTRVANNKMISFEINVSNSTINTAVSMDEFLFIPNLNKLLSLTVNEQTKIITISNNSISSFSTTGDSLWSIPVNNIVSKAEKILINNVEYIVLNNGNKLMVIDSEGKEKNGFPFSHSKSIIDFEYIKYLDGNERVFIYDGSEIKLINLNGELIKGWTFNNKQTLNSRMFYSSTGGKDYIYFTTSYDSLLVLNRKGELLFSKDYSVKPSMLSPKIYGDNNINSNRLIQLKNDYLISFYLTSGESDSIKLKIPEGRIDEGWIKIKDKNMLCIEYFDRVILINEFGFIEKELLKPEPNIELIYNKEAFLDECFIFLNSLTNALYLLDTYGNLKVKTEISSSNKISYQNKTLVIFLNKKLHSYHLN